MLAGMTGTALIQRLENYYDAVPRRRSDTEDVGPFTLFVARKGWPYYARPALGGPADVTTDDVREVLARQRELDVPQAIEWVDEMTPGLVDAVEAAGASVARCPLLVLEGMPRGDAGLARMLRSDEVDLVVATWAAVSVGFSAAGTGIGDEGIAARDAGLTSASTFVDDSLIERLGAGEIRMAAAFVEQTPEPGPVGGGSHNPVGDVTEIVGVGVLPAYRRRGLAAQLTYVLASDALDHGVTTVFCSAQSEDVARIYRGVGFERVGTACIASVDAD
jgi:ribosomal protein S18 acetylase RimI-like enzyme